MVLSSDKVTVRVHPVHLTDVGLVRSPMISAIQLNSDLIRLHLIPD